MGFEYPKLKRTVVGMLSFVLLMTGFLVAREAAAKEKKDVTFENKSKRQQELRVAFGGDGSCEDMPTQENVSLDPGASQVVSSGESRVCWCAGSGKAKVSECQEWNIARPGKKVRLTR